MRLIDKTCVLHDLRTIADLLPADKKAVMKQAIKVVESQPEIPIDKITKGSE